MRRQCQVCGVALLLLKVLGRPLRICMHAYTVRAAGTVPLSCQAVVAVPLLHQALRCDPTCTMSTRFAVQLNALHR